MIEGHGNFEENYAGLERRIFCLQSLYLNHYTYTTMVHT